MLKTKGITEGVFSCDPQLGFFDDAGTFHAASQATSGNLYVAYNGITASQHATIFKSPLKGDVNGDDKVNISDVTDLIDIILGGLPSNSAADVNSDGKVNISDVTDVIDIILNS